MKVIIVGGVAGGASAAARLRRLDENAQIIVFERGDYISYANCGLPYYIGGKITAKESLTLQSPHSFKSRFNVDVRTLSEVISVDTAAKTVTVRHSDKQYKESYDKLILSPGAAPLVPPIPGADGSRVFTIRNIPDTYKIKDYIETASPKSALIIGGGYIGTEMAENLTIAGLKVTIAEMSDHLIAPLDLDMAADVHKYLREKGIDIILNNAVTSLNDTHSNIKAVLRDREVYCDMVIMSAGVRPDTKFLQDSNIALTKKGLIKVDDTLKTSCDDVYAVGDAIEIKNFVTKQNGFIPLAGPANKQGRIAADNVCGASEKYNGTQGSSILKIFDMTVAATGINESAAAGLDTDKVFLWTASHATYYPGAGFMNIKVIFENKTGKILGAQIVGRDGVDKRIDVLAAAIRAGMTANDLAKLELAYAPPYSSAKDPVNMIGFMIQNILSGKVKQFHYNTPIPENAVKLDVRTAGEYERGHIDGAINIPVDSIRQRLDELELSKPVYVNCQSGMRSYIACRILSQSGFDCYNLAGGYRLYSMQA